VGPVAPLRGYTRVQVGLVKAVVKEYRDQRETVDTGGDRQTYPDTVDLAEFARDRPLFRNHFARAGVQVKEIILSVGHDPTVHGDDRNDNSHGNQNKH
jgi:hypothetical protein